MASLWTDGVSLPSFPSLDRDLETDVLIIGGGLCGVLCAYRLEQAGVRYALIEAGRICGGVSARTTAKITSQHGLIYHQLLHRLGGGARTAILRRQRGGACAVPRTLPGAGLRL